MGWTLVAAADELHRCAFVQDGDRCEQDTAVRIIDGSWSGYVHVCIGHAELVLTAEPGCTVEPVGSSAVAVADPAPIRALIVEIRSTLLQARHELAKVEGVPEAARARDAVQRGLHFTAQCAAKLSGA